MINYENPKLITSILITLTAAVIGTTLLLGTRAVDLSKVINNKTSEIRNLEY